ncbi:MAG TPA: hypothetical protein VKT72_14850 [Candidatus Baltobacteraceae bacterium]|nr:hypothetical protein [Candidatus Baltobacteraceae bacterium]
MSATLGVLPPKPMPAPPFGTDRTYAIAFDVDTDELRKRYVSSSFKHAYDDIRAVLQGHGFEWQQGSVYFGGTTVTPVTCVLAVQDLQRRYHWFGGSVRDIRMLRIEENSNLVPAIS